MAPWLNFLRQRIKLKCHQKNCTSKTGIYRHLPSNNSMFVWKLNSLFAAQEPPLRTVKGKLPARAIMEIVFRPWHFGPDFSTTVSLSHNPLFWHLRSRSKLALVSIISSKTRLCCGLNVLPFREVNLTLTLRRHVWGLYLMCLCCQ